MSLRRLSGEFRGKKKPKPTFEDNYRIFVIALLLAIVVLLTFGPYQYSVEVVG